MKSDREIHEQLEREKLAEQRKHFESVYNHDGMTVGESLRMWQAWMDCCKVNKIL